MHMYFSLQYLPAVPLTLLQLLVPETHNSSCKLLISLPNTLSSLHSPVSCGVNKDQFFFYRYRSLCSFTTLYYWLISSDTLSIHIQGVYKWMVHFQKITRNVFLTLHGQNVHRQQRQLSKFLMRYQQLAFHAYCGAAGSVYKMAPQQEKAFCVFRFEVSRSVITVQRAVQCTV